MKKTPIAIYGAQMVAVRVYAALKKLYPYVDVLTFIVSGREGNPSKIDGIPVIELKEFHQKDIEILIATPEVHHSAIISELQKRSFQHYKCIDSRTEAGLLEAFYGTEGRFLPLSFYPEKLKEPKAEIEQREEHPDVAVYMSKFYKDRPLKTSYAPPFWVHPLQAGAALTESRIAELLDNEGDNISIKNPNYSELTAAYWIGKHGTAEYLGLYHYRRILDVGEEELYRMQANDIDVVLPYPSMHYPNIQEHHKRYLKDSDWDAMLQALDELEPSYGAALPRLFEGSFFYNFNMMIAKKEIYQRYCNWMFPILARVEELSIPKGNERKDRYIGYLGESLTTLFFLYHEKDFRIAHTGCLMLI